MLSHNPTQDPQSTSDFTDAEITEITDRILEDPTPGERETIIEAMVDDDDIVGAMFDMLTGRDTSVCIKKLGRQIVERMVANYVLERDL